MAAGADLITEVATRLRDAGSGAHTRSLILRVMSHCQRAINLGQKVRRATVAFTPSAGRTLYRTSEVAADVGRIDRVIANERALPEIMRTHLISESSTWYRDLGNVPRAWARIGGNLFALLPAQVVPVSVQVVYTTVTADVIDDPTVIDLPDEWVPVLLDLTQSVMLCKARIYAPMDGPMSLVAKALQSTPPTGPAKVNP